MYCCARMFPRIGTSCVLKFSVIPPHTMMLPPPKFKASRMQLRAYRSCGRLYTLMLLSFLSSMNLDSSENMTDCHCLHGHLTRTFAPVVYSGCGVAEVEGVGQAGVDLCLLPSDGVKQFDSTFMVSCLCVVTLGLPGLGGSLVMPVNRNVVAINRLLIGRHEISA